MKESIKRQLDSHPASAFQEGVDGVDLNDVELNDVELNEARQWVHESESNQEFFQRLEACDDAIGKALHDVEVPTGFADKIRASVQSETSPNELLAAAIDDDGRLSPVHREEFACMIDEQESETVQTASSQADQNVSRRALIITASVVAVAAAVMLGVFFSGLLAEPSEPISAHQLCRTAATWDPNSAGEEWNRNMSAAPENYPVSDRLNVNAGQWKRLANQYDSNAVVYDMTPPGDTQIFLFAIRSDDQFDVPAVFPADPVYSVDGFSIGTCHRDGVTYVLLVEGDKQRYGKVVKSVGEFV